MEQELLTLPQKRALTSSLRIFESALRKADRLLGDADEKGIFVSRGSRIDIQQKRRIQEKITETLKDLAEFSRTLKLESDEVEDFGSVIRAEMSISWESLEESRSKRLKGYGEINPSTAKLIDSAITHFSQVALEIGQMVSSESDHINHEDNPE